MDEVISNYTIAFADYYSLDSAGALASPGVNPLQKASGLRPEMAVWHIGIWPWLSLALFLVPLMFQTSVICVGCDTCTGLDGESVLHFFYPG